ncbi:hypothetical protein ACJMK2_010020, partial [Sinanodonta woodiana]
MALKMRAIINIGARCPKNPDDLIRQYHSNETIIEKIQDTDVATISFKHWKRVQEGNTFRHREVEEELLKNQFIKLLDKDLTEFRDHVVRVRLIIWMDFAENFQCSSVEEVQSAYWNAPVVSLHTMVVYFPSGMSKSIQSYVSVTDVMIHNASA